MRLVIIALVVLAAIALGWLMCPRVPDVNPRLVLNRTLAKHGICPQCASLIRRNYTPLVEGREQIAGRSAWVLRMKPDRKRTPWKQLWIDTKTHAVLARREWSSRNELVWAGRLGPGMRQCRHTKKSALSRLVGKLVMPAFLPKGFGLPSVEVDSKRASSQVVYTDGLYAISVFQGREAETAGRDMSPGRVYDWGHGMIVSKRVDGRTVLTVADLPADDLRRIADSLRVAVREAPVSR